MTGEYQDNDQILVTLTTEIVRDLSLPQTDVSAAILADGSVVQLVVHEVAVVWHEEKRIVPAYVGDGEPLLGMSLLRGSIGTFEFFSGGTTTIEAVD